VANQPALRACLSVSGLTMGTLLGPIREVEADHICVGAAAPIALPEGMRCDYALGTVVRLVYTERAGRQEVVSIEPIPEAPAPPGAPWWTPPTDGSGSRPPSE
jgi:hypothetical protein